MTLEPVQSLPGTALQTQRRQRARRSDTLAEKFWARVLITDSCYLWRGSRSTNGRALLYTGSGLVPAHRVSYELHTGAIPEDHFVCHTCGNLCCVRPEHLFLGTREQHRAEVRAFIGPTRARRGQEQAQAKLTPAEVRRIRRQYASRRYTLRALAEKYQVSTGLIHKIVRRKKWAHLT